MEADFTHSRCLICDRRLTVDQAAAGSTCDDPRCRQRIRVRQTAVDAARRGRLLAELAEVRERARRQAVPAHQPVPLALLPFQEISESRLPAKRRDQFRQHLEAAIREALDRLPDPKDSDGAGNRPIGSAPKDEELKVMSHACATCQGSCCKWGGDHAFLHPDEMRVKLMTAGAGDAEELLGYYIAQLPAVTVTDSCVYHTSKGCALKREARARRCNDYFCGDLANLWHSLNAANVANVFVGAVAGERFVRYAFIDQEGATPIRADGRQKWD